jgi:tripartite-type tricarboxylate transporter receptor subunit TctC
MFGVASSPRIAAEIFMAEAGIHLNPVPYRGETEAVMDLLGGSVPAYFGTTAQLVEQHRAGKLRIIATTFTERMKVFPDVPTFQEEGLKKVVYRWFHGLMLPAGTPQPIIDRYVKELNPIVTSDRFRDGISPDLVPVSMSPAEFTDMALAARERVAVIIRDRDLKGKA